MLITELRIRLFIIVRIIIDTFYDESLFCIIISHYFRDDFGKFLRFQKFSELKRGCFWRITYFFYLEKILKIKITFFLFNFLFWFSSNFLIHLQNAFVWVSKMITGLSLQKVWNVDLIFSPKFLISIIKNGKNWRSIILVSWWEWKKFTPIQPACK